MNWKSLIEDLQRGGLSQAAIGAQLGKSQGWVCAVLGGKYQDLTWSDGEALIQLHTERCPVAQPQEEPA